MGHSLRKSFVRLVLCGVGMRASWLLSKGALVGPLDQLLLLKRCNVWEMPIRDALFTLKHRMAAQLFAV